VKDQFSDQRGRSEWEPTKIHLKNRLDYAPESTPNPNIHDEECNRQGHVVTTELPTLGAILGSTSRSTNQITKALSQIYEPHADCPQGWADCLWGQGRPFVIADQTSSSAPQKMDRLMVHFGPSDAQGPSVPCSQTV
jgi:hypothetical protein